MGVDIREMPLKGNRYPVLAKRRGPRQFSDTWKQDTVVQVILDL